MSEDAQEMNDTTADNEDQPESEMHAPSPTPLSEAVLIEEYGFPHSARLLAEGEQFRPGDYLIDPEKKQILLIGNGCTYQVFKKNRLALKLRQRSTRRADTARYCHAARIDPADAPPAHQMALLPVGSYVEVPAGKIGIITATGVRHGAKETAFTDIQAETIANLHPQVKPQNQKRNQQFRGKQDKGPHPRRKPESNVRG